MGGLRNACTILVGKAEGKRPLGIFRHRRDDYIGEIEWKVWSGCIWLRIGTNGWLL
jgi:hypothetical protein